MFLFNALISWAENDGAFFEEVSVFNSGGDFGFLVRLFSSATQERFALDAERAVKREDVVVVSWWRAEFFGGGEELSLCF